MKRTYIDIKGKIHNYNYESDNRTVKAKCDICHNKMNYINAKNLGKYEKLGFVCFKCKRIFINNTFTSFKCNIEIKLNKRMRDD